MPTREESTFSNTRAPPEIEPIYAHLPIHVAAIRGDKDQLKQVIANISRSDIKSSVCEQDGSTPLHLAARHGNARCVRLLVKQKIPVDVKDKLGNTALHLAASFNHRRSAELLLNAGAQISPVNKEGWCPIHNAIKSGYAQMVSLLLDKGASPDETPSPSLHPLLLCAQFKRTDITRLLVSKCKNLNPTSESGRTPMHVASDNGAADIVGVLVMNGANVNAVDAQGIVPLQLAIDREYDDICHTLTTNGADVSLRYAAGKKPRRDSTTVTIDDFASADRYGHISISSQQQQTSSESDSKSQSQKKVKKELSRAQKWLKMMKNWDKFSAKKFDKVIKRAEKGIPDRIRGEAWKLLSGATTQMQAHKDKYAELSSKKSEWVTQIDLDVNRSSRNHLQFRERYGKGQVALFTALKAYSVYDEEVGYCQGMSDITSLLLKYVTEQEAFWMLERLMYDPKWNMRDLVLPGFPRLQAAFQIHEILLKEYCPTLAAHLLKENVVPAFYATKWYLMAFLDIFPFDVTVRLWDVLFAEGYEMVFTFGVNVLMMYEDKLLGMTFDRIMGFFRSLETNTDLDTEKFMKSILKHKIPVKKIRKIEASLKKTV